MKVSFTSLSEWRQCHRRALWGQQYAPLTISPNFWFGGHVHGALAAYYGEKQDPVVEFQRLAKRGEKDLRDPATYEELYTLGTGVLQHYLLWAADHDVMDNIKVKKTEERFELRVPGTAHEIVGKVDQTLAMGAKRKNYVGEIKTMSTLSKEWLLLSEQATLYLWAARQKWPKMAWEGVVFTLIRKKVPTVPEDRKGQLWMAANAASSTYAIKSVAQTLKLKPDELVERYAEKEEADGNPFVQRVVVKRTEAQVRQMVERITQIISEMETSAPFPNPSIITCPGCPFHEPCVAMERGDNYQVLLRDLYKEKR